MKPTVSPVNSPGARKKFLAVLLVLQWIATVHAENLYVTPAGAGSRSGANWSNAFAGFGGVVWGGGAGQLGAGDTLWVAGGAYSSQLQLKGSGTAGNLINIKRARSTNSECSSAVGWLASYDSQVVINATDGIMISSSLTNGPGRYTVVDGQVKDGIRVNFPDVSGGRGILIEGYGSFNSTFRNIGSYGPATNVLGLHPAGFVNDVRCLVIRTYNVSPTTPFPADLVFEYDTFAGSCAMAFFCYVSRVTVQNSEIHTIETINSDVHANLIYVMRSDNCTIRNNNFHDNAAGVGIFFTDFGSSGVQSSNFFIYGNIFRDTNMTSERFIEVRDTAAGTGPLFIYNNTFVHGYGGVNINAPLNPNAESYIRNNLFVNIAPSVAVSVPGGADYVTVSDNIITNSYAMFVNPGSTNVLPSPYAWQWVRDLHLKTGSIPVNAGANLGSPYNVDIDGKTRGADGAWDIGAYEAQSGATAAAPSAVVSPAQLVFGAVAVGATSNLAFTVQNAGGGTLSGTASVAAPFSIVSGGSYNLAGGQTQVVTVAYSPVTAGGSTQTVTFTGGTGPVTRTVSGSAYNLPAISVTPSTRNFGSILTGTTTDQTFTVQNTGGGTLSGSASVAAPFSIVSGGTYNLGAGLSQVVTVRYSPTAAGTVTQGVSFTGGSGASASAIGSATDPVPPPPPTGLRVIPPQ